jgi:polyisoprenoid-binding protein YceI
MRSATLRIVSPLACILAIVLQPRAAFPAPDATIPADTGRYVLAPQGTEARYRVREQLAGIDFPSDAVGKTSKVEGQIVVDAKGAVVAEQSKFTVDLASLVTDSDRRDNFVRRNTLQTEQFATAVFVPREFKGLRFPLAPNTDIKFQMVGDLTIRDQTKPVTWEVTAKLVQGAITGQANTKFTFADFAMTKPRVRSVLSVDDDIKLELDFRLVRPGAAN